jgi:exonuclease III
MKRIVALNVQSGAAKCAAGLCRYLDDLDAHTVVLSEWRRANATFADWAERRGMTHAGLDNGNTPNGVFVASQDHFKSESVRPQEPGAGCLMLARFDGLTLLACYFPQRKAKCAFFTRCLEVAAQLQDSRFVLIGDLNTGNQIADRSQKAAKFYCANEFDQLKSVGKLEDLWRRTNGARQEWSWCSSAGNGFRIDHAFGNHALVAATAPVCSYDRQAWDAKLTDHSAILVRTG